MKKHQRKDSLIFYFFGWVGIIYVICYIYFFDSGTPIEKEVIEIQHVKESTYEDDACDSILDAERKAFKDSILLEDVKEIYGFETLEEYYQKHDSLVTIGTKYHKQYINN